MFNLAVIRFFLLHYKIINTISSLKAVVQRCFVKKGVLRKFAKFLGKHLYQSLFFNKVAGLPVNFVKCLRTSFFTEHLWWLLLFSVEAVSSFALLFFLIVYKKTDEWYIEWQRVTTRGATTDKEWQRVIQRVTTNDKEWQQMTASDNEWCNKWWRVATSNATSDSDNK